MTPTIKLPELEGTWYINQSNFPMWLKGDKKKPSFNYKLKKKKNIWGLEDIVAYHKNEKRKTIVGFDKPLDDKNTYFVWRGKSFMSVLTSKWKILHFDRTQNWILLRFEKTLFTPAGYDIISRKKVLSPAILAQIAVTLKNLNIKEKLTPIPQE